MSLLKRARKKLEVWITRVALVIVPRIPRGPLISTARCAGRLAYLLFPTLRKVGRANLDLVFGSSLSTEEKRRILRCSFQAFAIVLCDIFWFTRRPRERLSRHVRFEPGLIESVGDGPELYVTGHLGNWETLGQAVANAGLPLYSVAAPLSNPEVDQLFIPSRELSGQTILSREGALIGLLSALRNGACAAVLLDQNTKPVEGGVFVPFFGLPVPIATGPAYLALKTKSQLVFGFCLLGPDGTYSVHSPARITPPEIEAMAREGNHAAERLTARIAAELEAAVRAHPEAWLWMYRRWKHMPPGSDPATFPFYAKQLPPNEAAKARVFSQDGEIVTKPCLPE